MKKYKRKKGKPRNGRLTIRAKRLYLLPDESKISQIAKALNIRPSTIIDWIYKENLPTVDKDKLLRVTRDDLIRFLVKTKRTKPVQT